MESRRGVRGARQSRRANNARRRGESNAENEEITVENDEIIGPAGTKDTAEALDSRFVTRLRPMRNSV